MRQWLKVMGISLIIVLMALSAACAMALVLVVLFSGARALS